MKPYLDPVRTCPICESTRLAPAFQVYYWKENPLQFYDCNDCRAAFANPMPSDELISQGNNALVRYYQQSRTLEQEFREGRQAYLRGKLLGKKLSRWKKKGRVLELGCYHGFVSLGVRENSDWTVEGLEISSELQSFIEGTLGFKCYLGTLENADLPEDAYDFVICHDLIEHVNRPKVFLKKLSSILAPGGRVQIITPNGRQDLAFTRRAFQAGKPMPMLLNHIMYFSPETLSRALQGVGLNAVEAYCYDIRHTAKDFGLFGMGKPSSIPGAPSMQEALHLPEKKTLSFWTKETLDEMRRHKKTSSIYGFLNETLPKALRIRVPYRLGIGHEIYMLAEKRV